MNTYDLSLIQKSKYVDNLYTYKSEQDYNIGDIVQVGFGIGNKIVDGIVVQKNKSVANAKTKSILQSLEHTYSLSPAQIDFALFVKEQYMCSYYEAFKLFTAPSKYTRLSENFTLQISVCDEKKLDDLILSTRKNSKNKLSVFNALKKYPLISKDMLEQMLDIKVSSHIKQLEEEGIITTQKISVFDDKNFKSEHIKDVKLNKEQQTILDEIIKNYEDKKNSQNIDNTKKIVSLSNSTTPSYNSKPILIHGITGSGKTQIYIKLIKYLLSKNKTAIILVPEISLTMQTINRFASQFSEDIAVIHSGLTKREKFEQWLKIKNGISKIVIGARSALFAPIQNLGAIIIDECHDEAYKSEQAPKYDTIELAHHISSKLDCLLILSTATPTIAQYYYAKKGIYDLYTLDKRANSKPLPTLEIVNMLEEMKNGNKTDISSKLQLEMKKELAKGNQVILFLNKRGYSNQLTCDNCGHVPKCDNCDISLTYHKPSNTYKCHYCNFETKAYSLCTNCNDGHFIYMGSGTQKIEQQVKVIFPSATVFRMDKDVSKEKNDIQEIFTEFKNTPMSVLIGTQMIGKGHDFPKVSLVGVINADQGINSPDYKAFERSYNIIEQVGGRAGRGDTDGKVIIQSYSYTNSILYYLKTHSYEDFYEDEIKKRELFKYEPFGNIIRLLVSSEDEQQAYSSALKIKDAINFYNNSKLSNILKIYEPSICVISKIDKKYRYQIVIRVDNDNIGVAKKMINYTLTKKRKVVLTSDKVSVSIDVNPDNML